MIAPLRVLCPDCDGAATAVTFLSAGDVRADFPCGSAILLLDEAREQVLRWLLRGPFGAP